MSSPATIARPTQATAPIDAENAAIFERACQRYLRMTTEEFLHNWNSGYFAQHVELAHKAADVALLLPLLSAR